MQTQKFPIQSQPYATGVGQDNYLELFKVASADASGPKTRANLMLSSQLVSVPIDVTTECKSANSSEEYLRYTRAYSEIFW